MSGIKCVYNSCGKCPRKYPGLRMFRFPAKDEIRLKAWVTNSGNASLVGLSDEQLRNKYICEHHFSVLPGRKIKTRNAVPKNYLGVEDVLPTEFLTVNSTASLVYSEIEKCTGRSNAEKSIKDGVINYLNAIPNESKNNSPNPNAIDKQIIVEILKPKVKKPIICIKGTSTTNKSLSSATVKQEPIKIETQEEDFLYDSFMRFYHITKNKPKHVQSRIIEKISLLLDKKGDDDDVSHGTTCTKTEVAVNTFTPVLIKTEIQDEFSEDYILTSDETFDAFVKKYEPE